ncbi:hypothetical protein FRC03_008571 [Tulasnella sp. 419]|nr:hypothetical protein FRC03_008571 [Tulasnella sp. 419]
MNGIYHPDAIRDVADSLGLHNISDGVASLLASDVEYRLHQVIQEASRFARHAHRTTLTASDIDLAFKVLNIEPVYGHSDASAPMFKRAYPSAGQPVYALQDEEVDFERIVREEEIPVPRAVSWTAHWLAIEGVQPLIPENPSPIKPAQAPKPPSQAQAQNQNQNQQAPAAAAAKPHPTVKSQLSRELQQYYARLTDSLTPGPADAQDRQVERKRTAALSSLRNDAGLQGILPYLVKWIGDGVTNALTVRGLLPDVDDGMDAEEDVDRRTLEVNLLVINAILDNQRLFVEPYLHTLLPPLLSILLTSTLSSSSSYSTLPSSSPIPKALRTHAASLLSHLLQLHAASYPSLPPRITKTLLVSLLDEKAPGSTTDDSSRAKPLSLGTKEGAIRGLMGVGQEATYRGLVGARLDPLHPQPSYQMNATPSIDPQAVAHTKAQLTDMFGSFFAERVVARDEEWAVGLATTVIEREGSGSFENQRQNGLSDTQLPATQPLDGSLEISQSMTMVTSPS